MSAVRFTAPRSDRLDRLLATEVPGLSRAQAQRLVEHGHIQVDGAPADKAAQAIGLGAAVDVALPERDLVAAADVPLDVLFEDEHTLVINKQAGLIVHPVPGLEAVTLVDVVRQRYPEVEEIDDGDRPGVVHRLDRETSGVMVFAKSAEAQYHMKEQWRARETLKVYRAIAEGFVEPRAGIIDAPLGADPADPRHRAVVEAGEPAHTEYRVLEQYGDEAALLDVRIRTGRTHQIRVHLEAIGHPVLGDWLYGRPSALIARQALHAYRLGFRLASTGEWREFEAPLPADMMAALDDLRARHPAGDGMRGAAG